MAVNYVSLTIRTEIDTGCYRICISLLTQNERMFPPRGGGKKRPPNLRGHYSKSLFCAYPLYLPLARYTTSEQTLRAIVK